MTNSKIKKILSKIEHIKNQVNTNGKVAKVEKTKEFKTKALKVLKKTLNSSPQIADFSPLHVLHEGTILVT